MAVHITRDGHNDEDQVVKQSPVRASGLSEVQLVIMGKGLYRNWKTGMSTRKKRAGGPRFKRGDDD